MRGEIEAELDLESELSIWRPARAPAGVPKILMSWNEARFEEVFGCSLKELDRTWNSRLVGGKTRRDCGFAPNHSIPRIHRLRMMLGVGNFRLVLRHPVLSDLVRWSNERLGFGDLSTPEPGAILMLEIDADLRGRLEDWRFIPGLAWDVFSSDGGIVRLNELWKMLVGGCSDESIELLALAFWANCDMQGNHAPLHLAGQRDKRIAEQFSGEKWAKWFAMPFDGSIQQPFLATAEALSHFQEYVGSLKTQPLNMEPKNLQAWSQIWKNLVAVRSICDAATTFDKGSAQTSAFAMALVAIQGAVDRMQICENAKAIAERERFAAQLAKLRSLLDRGRIDLGRDDLALAIKEWCLWVDKASKEVLSIEQSYKQICNKVEERSKEALKNPDALRKALDAMQSYGFDERMAKALEGEPVVSLPPCEEEVDAKTDEVSNAGGIDGEDSQDETQAAEIALLTSELQEAKAAREVAEQNLAAEREKTRAAGERITELQADLQEQSEVRQACGTFECRDSVLERAPEKITPEVALALAAGARPMLRVLPSAFESARRSAPFRHAKRLLGLLLDLGGAYAQALASGQPDTTARAVLGSSYKAGESDTTMSVKEYREARTFEVDGEPVLMEQHVGIGTAPNLGETIRVHFAWIEGRIVVGYVGEHLPTMAKA